MTKKLLAEEFKIPVMILKDLSKHKTASKAVNKCGEFIQRNGGYKEYRVENLEKILVQ